MEEIWNEIVKEAEDGQIIIEDWYYNIHFHTVYSNNGGFLNSAPVLHIRNKTNFLKKLSQYLETVTRFRNVKQPLNRTQIKEYLSFLWTNATYQDFEEPQEYIDKMISFYEASYIEADKVDEISKLLNSSIISETVMQSIHQETPFAFQTKVTNGIDDYPLPSISYGLKEGTCYIYAIQMKEKIPDTPYAKKIKRSLYQLNEGILKSETQEYKDYKEGISDYYPENMSDISPSALLSLTVFLSQLDQIKKLVVVPFLPIRYYAKEKAIEKKILYAERKQMPPSKQKELKESLETEQLRIQNNLTQKLIRNFNRLMYYMPHIQICSYNLEVDENLTMTIGTTKQINQPLLEEIVSKSRGGRKHDKIK